MGLGKYQSLNTELGSFCPKAPADAALTLLGGSQGPSVYTLQGLGCNPIGFRV